MIPTFAAVIGAGFLIYGAVLSELVEGDLKVLVWVISVITFATCIITCLYEDYNGGNYKCPKCGRVFKPSFLKYVMAAHIMNTWHLECPECGEKSWCKRLWGEKE